MSSIGCAFAYQESYCPSCPVTQSELDDQKDETTKMQNVAIAVSIVALFLRLGIGLLLGARSKALAEKVHEGAKTSSSQINLSVNASSPRRKPRV